MGKGDRKTRRGKIYNGSFGKSRPKDPAKRLQESQEGCRQALVHSARRSFLRRNGIPHDLQCRPLIGRQLDV